MKKMTRFWLICAVAAAMLTGFLLTFTISNKQSKMDAQTQPFGLAAQYTDYAVITPPANPSTGFARVFVNSANSTTSCLLSGGQSCSPSNTYSATTGTITGSLLAVGACNSTTVAVGGAAVSMVSLAQASDGTNLAALGFDVIATVTSVNTVTVAVCATIAGTPPNKTYNVRVIG